jgi:hypothetical protein
VKHPIADPKAAANDNEAPAMAGVGKMAQA